MISVGESLRRERLRRNLDLSQISQDLKISPKFLEAIEDNRFENLPGGVFAKSFVRQYARLLDLDEEELAGEVRRQLEEEAPLAVAVGAQQGGTADISLPRVERWDGGVVGISASRSSLPALAGFVVVLLVCSGIYALWQRSRRSVSAQEQTPVAAAVQPRSDEPAATPAAVPEQPAVPVAGSGNPAAPPAAPAQEVLTPPVAPAETASRALEGERTLRVEVTATEPVWILAQGDGKFLFSGTLEPSQSRTVEASGQVLLRLGNAGGVEITFNGKPIGAVGPRGQVRTVQFTSGGFHIVAVPKPSLPLDDIL
jgi:cytoskeleton protein RodZ